MDGNKRTPRQKSDSRDAWRKNVLLAGIIAAGAMLLIGVLQLMALAL